eukprot:SAG11_NODE_6377_length_1325_cov_5.438010_1_plen_46_part_01
MNVPERTMAGLAARGGSAMYPTRDSAQAERVREMEFGIGWMKMRRR